MSDTHDTQDYLTSVPDGDILIHAGDFTFTGGYDELERFRSWFSELPHEHKIVIPGNHELSLSDDRRVIAESYMKDFHYLVDQEVVIDNVKFYGSPWNHNLRQWGFYSHDCNRKWNGIPDNTDVLITHAPPYGILDKIITMEKVGCPDLKHQVQERIKPKIHIFGHIHESRGILYQDDTVYVNTSSLNHQYEPADYQYYTIDFDENSKRVLKVEERTR